LEFMNIPFQRLHPFPVEVEQQHSTCAQAAFCQFGIRHKLRPIGLKIKLGASTKGSPSEIDCDIKPP
jgi:hypothetical protein